MEVESTPLRATALAAISALLILTGTGLAVYGGGYRGIPDASRLPEYFSVIGLLSSAAGFLLGHYVVRRRLEMPDTANPPLIVERRADGMSVILKGDPPSTILGVAFLGAMFMPLVSCLFLLVPILEFVKGKSFDWYEWAGGFATLAGMLSGVGIVGSLLFTIPGVASRTLIDFDRRRIEIRWRGLIFRSRRRLPPADIAAVETYYAGVKILDRNGKSHFLISRCSKADDEMLCGLIQEFAGRTP